MPFTDDHAQISKRKHPNIVSCVQCCKSCVQYAHIVSISKSTKCSLIQTAGELLVNKTDLGALTLLGPTREDPVLDPLAVLHLDN